MLATTPNSIPLERKGDARQPRAVTASFFPPTPRSSSATKRTHQLCADFCRFSAVFCPKMWEPLGMLAGLGWSHSVEGTRGDWSTAEESPPCPPVRSFLPYRQPWSAGAAPDGPWGAHRKGQRRQCRRRVMSHPRSRVVLLADYLRSYFPL